MDHGDEVEREAQASEVERLALPDFEQPLGDAVESADHLQGLGVSDDLQPGVEAAQGDDRRRVVGFHVVDHEVVDLPLPDDFTDVGLEQAAVRGLDGVDQGDFVPDDQVCVVRYAEGQRPEGLEARCRAVVHSDVMDSGKYLRNVHDA